MYDSFYYVSLAAGQRNAHFPEFFGYYLKAPSLNVLWSVYSVFVNYLTYFPQQFPVICLIFTAIL